MRSRFTAGLASALLLTSSSTGSAQDDRTSTLTFEAVGPGVTRAGWAGGPAASLSLDSTVVHGGRYAGRIDRDATSPAEFSTFVLNLPRTVAGDTIELRGWVRTRDVTGFGGLWLRQDGDTGPVQFDSMQRLRLAGTTGWTQYRLALPLDDRTRTIVVGALLSGQGTVWVDDLELRVNGRPLAEAPAYDPARAAASLARLDAGSGIETRPLSPAQVDNLVLLGQVWGFVKYHHPRVTAGEVDWDRELFRVLPSILAAPDRAAAARRLSAWLGELGEPAPCGPCAAPPRDPHLAPNLDWTRDAAALGEELSARLSRIHASRPAGTAQRYVSHVPGVGNPDFSKEASYPGQSSPDAGFRLLALFRFWNIVQYWFPYRDVIGEDWNGVLREFVPRLMAAEGPLDYDLEMIRLIARINDTHANIWSPTPIRPPRGLSQLPIVVRFVEGRPVVAGYSHPRLGPATGLRAGDVLVRIADAPVDSLVRAWRPYYPASNEPTRLRDIAYSITRGDAGPVRVSALRDGRPLEVVAERVPLRELDLRTERTHDLPGETFQRLTDEVAYLKLSTVQAAEAADYIRRAEGARVLVIDIRNYPAEFVVFALGGHLVARPTEFVRFTGGDGANPGAFGWSDPLALPPLEPRFTGTVVVLVDETTQSQAEYTTMALRSAPNTLVVGSTTAGADGNVSEIPLPGGIRSMISGIGVFYPDRTPTQRVGIVPDLEVRPTIAGIREGRDEVLEAAVSRALGRPWSR